VAQKVEEGLARAMPNMIDSIVSKLAEKLKWKFIILAVDTTAVIMSVVFYHW
jgi:hypothetical protein